MCDHVRTCPDAGCVDRKLLSLVAWDPERVDERDILVLDDRPFVHVIREVIDDSGPAAQQGMRTVVLEGRPDSSGIVRVHRIDLLWPLVAFKGILVGYPRNVYPRLVAVRFVKGRHSLSPRPLPH